MAIGDNWNDREMLEFAGVPVVMGNGVAELKSLGLARHPLERRKWAGQSDSDPRTCRSCPRS